MPAVFLSNAMLEQWADQGKVRLDDTTLTLLSEKRTVKLTPAVRFTKLIDDAGGDPQKLLGKVKTKEQLTEIGAEHYLDSVIFGDIGYTVVEGFVGDLSPQARGVKPGAPAPDALAPTSTEAARAPAPVPVELPPAATPVPGSPPEVSEAEALSQLFLQTVKS